MVQVSSEITYEEYMKSRKPEKEMAFEPNLTFEDYMKNRGKPVSGEPLPRVTNVSPQEEKKQIENIVDWSDEFELPPITMEQLYEPVANLLKAIPDPKDVNTEALEIEKPMKLEAGEEEEGVLKTLLGFKYPPKPPGWKDASPIEKFNYITLPISDVLGRIGGKIASGWRMMKKEDVQKLLVNELDEDLKWYQKTPEAAGWTAGKVAEYLALKGIFKASGLHKALTWAGQKAAAPFIAKEITKAGGLQSVKTLSGAGIKNLIRKGITSFLTASPENTAFISSWSALDAFMKGGDIKEEAIGGAKWALVLTGVFSAVAPLTQVPELRLAFQKAIANVGRRFPGMLDKLGKPVTAEVEKEWLKAISKSRGKDLRMIDLTVRERQIFRNAIRAAEKEILKAAEKEAAIKAYWSTKAAKAAEPAKKATKEITKIVVEEPKKPIVKAVVAKPPAEAKQPWETVKSKLVKEKPIGIYDEGPLGEDVLVEPLDKQAVINKVRQNEGEEAAKVVSDLLDKEINTIDTHVKKDEIIVQIEAAPSVPESAKNMEILRQAGLLWEPRKGMTYVRIPLAQEALGKGEKVTGPLALEGEKWYQDRWDTDKLGKRVSLIMQAGWKTKAGKLSKLGEKLAQSKWDDLSPAAQNVLRDYLDKWHGRKAPPEAKQPAEEKITITKETLAERKYFTDLLLDERKRILDEMAEYETEFMAEGVQQRYKKRLAEIDRDLRRRGYTGEKITIEAKPIEALGKQPTVKPTVEAKIDKQQLESDEIALSDMEIQPLIKDTMPKGMAIAPDPGAVRDAYNRAHDWMLTFGQAKREDPELYDELMKAYGKRNAGVERAIDQVGRLLPKDIKLDDDIVMAMVYEDKRLEPKSEIKETYDKFKLLLDEMSKKQKEEGLYSQPFNERLIEENNKQIEKITQEVLHPHKSKRIMRLRAENELLKNMRYLPHSIVAKRTIESKINTLSGEKKTAYLQRLSAFYKKRKGKMTLKMYMKAGLITKDDMRMSRLATEEVADYYIRSAYKGLYDYGKAKEYIKPYSKELHNEGWLTAKELGISALELKEQIVHPLFGSALAEMKAMRTGRGSYISQLFGAVKIGQFIKPTIVWVYDAVQHFMRGMYSFNPITEAKAMNEAFDIVLSKTELYHKLNESNLYQFPYEITRAHREEEIAKFINQHSAEIDKVTKMLEKTFDTRWLDPDITLTDMIRKISVAAHRGMAQITWTGDKIQRTQSYLILRKMGYSHDEAVKVAAASHGGYSLLSEKYKKFMSNKLFVYSFRFLMPMEMGKTITEPIIAAKDAIGGKKIPKHQWERMVKAVVGTAMIPIAIDEYMQWRGFEKEGKHLGPLAWKWSKEVTIDGETRELVVGINDILNMPVKYWNRVTQYNPIDKTTRGLQVVKNLMKWEVHPIYRIWFWDIADNRRSFGTGVSVYDTEANPAIQFTQIVGYAIGQSFRFFGQTMDAVGEGNMTDKERAEQEKIFDSALTGADKMLFWALGYKYIRQPIEQRRAIMQKSLEKELTTRLFENARKYEGEELEKRKEGLRRWAEKCENWIKNDMK